MIRYKFFTSQGPFWGLYQGQWEGVIMTRNPPFGNPLGLKKIRTLNFGERFCEHRHTRVEHTDVCFSAEAGPGSRVRVVTGG